jgi:hypothetical protein
MEHDACLSVFGDGAFRTGLSTDGFVAVSADAHPPHEIELTIQVFRAIRLNRYIFIRMPTIWATGVKRELVVFLFAGNLTGLASPTRIFFVNELGVIHS